MIIGTRIIFVTGLKRGILPKYKNVTGRVMAITKRVVTNALTINLRNLLLIFEPKPLFAISLTEIMHPSIARKDKIRLSENILYGEIIQITVTDKNREVIISPFSFRKKKAKKSICISPARRAEALKPVMAIKNKTMKESRNIRQPFLIFSLEITKESIVTIIEICIPLRDKM